MVGFEESGRRNEHPVASQSDPVVLEINRLQNQLKGLSFMIRRESSELLRAAQSEIKALKATDAAKDRALEELENEVDKLDERLRAAENLLEQKNLEISRLLTEKKDALAAHCAAEATLRRVYASQKDSDSVRIESFIAPLEAENKIYRNEVAALQEDKKTLERLTKSKELALLEAEKILESALERALIVEEVQNENIDLRRQIEICLEENKILDKTNRQKVVEVEKLSQTVRELEEAILAAGSAANTVRDCQRQISEINEEKRVLERELARARVAANRVATVVVNEWKDESERVMPVKQWLEERRLLQAEMQRLRDKLKVSERATKAETQLKEKLQLRLKTLEDGLKRVVTPCASPKTDKPNQLLGFFSGKVAQRKRSSSQPRASRASPLQQPNGNDAGAGDLKRRSSFRTDASAQNLVVRNLWATRCKVADPDTAPKEDVEEKTVIQPSKSTEEVVSASAEIEAKKGENQEAETYGNGKPDGEDMVSGFLYDRLQKEVINLRKLFEAKESELNSKDEEIKNLTRKVDALTKSIEVESRKIKREFFAKEKEAALSKSDENKSNRNLNLSKRFSKISS